MRNRGFIANLVDSTEAIVVQRLIIFATPLVLAFMGWGLTTAYDGFADDMHKNTQALNTLAMQVGTIEASNREELRDHENRLNRLEIQHDHVEKGQLRL